MALFLNLLTIYVNEFTATYGNQRKRTVNKPSTKYAPSGVSFAVIGGVPLWARIIIHKLSRMSYLGDCQFEMGGVFSIVIELPGASIAHDLIC
jgi:hypothetical protein